MATFDGYSRTAGQSHVSLRGVPSTKLSRKSFKSVDWRIEQADDQESGLSDARYSICTRVFLRSGPSPTVGTVSMRCVSKSCATLIVRLFTASATTCREVGRCIDARAGRHCATTQLRTRLASATASQDGRLKITLDYVMMELMVYNSIFSA